MMERALVGREIELQLLDRALAAAVAEGAPHLALLRGEAGIGKTHLLECFAERVRVAGGCAAVVRCEAGFGTPPLWPWLQLLAEIGAPGAEALRTEADPFARCEQLVARLGTATRDRPLVLAIDDLQDGDEASLHALAFVARHARGRLLLLATLREQHPGRSDSSRSDALVALVRQADPILELGALDRDACRELVERVSRVPPPPATIDGLYRRSGGNPLFLLALLRQAEQGDSEGPLPSDVRAVLGPSLAPLDPEAATICALAALLGGEVRPALLARAGGSDATQVREALARAARLGVLVETRGGALAFAHPLFAELLASELGTQRRAALHLAAGRAIEALYGGDLGPHLHTVARHYAQAREAGLDAPALDVARRAAERAAALGDCREAVEAYRLALRELAGLRPDLRLRTELLLELGSVLRRAGDPPAAREAFREAATAARELDDASALARAALGYGGPWSEAGVIDEQLVRLLEDALARLGSQDAALRSQLMGRLAQELSFTERAIELVRESLASARRSGSPDALSRALHAHHAACFGPDNHEERLALASELAELADARGDREFAFHAQYWLFGDHLEAGDGERVEAALDAESRLADDLGHPLYRSRAACHRATWTILRGRLVEAEEFSRHALALGVQAGNQTARLIFAIQDWMLRRERARLPEVDDAMATVVTRFPQMPAWRCAYAALKCDLGQGAEARAEFDALAARGFETLPRDAYWMFSQALLAEACAWLGDARAAESLYALLLPYRARHVVGGRAAVGCYGSVERHLALLARALGRLDEAAEHGERALAANTRLGATPWSAYTQLELARLLGERGHSGDAERAAELAAAAREIAERLGLVALAARAASAPVPRPAQSECSFERAGEYWTIAYDGRLARLRHAKGLAYLAVLLASPHREFHASELPAAAGEPAGALGAASDAGELLDAQAVREVRARLVRLHAELEVADRSGDERADALRAEIRFLEHALRSGVGLGGRLRRSGDTNERARKAVANRIRASLERIASVNPSLSRHLEQSIRTGTWCSYEPATPTLWRV